MTNPYILRRIWKLPRHSHTAVCHCLSHVPAVRNQVYKRFLSLHSSAMLSSSPLVKSVFSTSSLLVFTFTGYNFLYGSTHVKTYSDNYIAFASVIYDNICKHFGFNSSHESLVATRYIMLLIMLLLLFLIIFSLPFSFSFCLCSLVHLYWCVAKYNNNNNNLASEIENWRDCNY